METTFTNIHVKQLTCLWSVLILVLMGCVSSFFFFFWSFFPQKVKKFSLAEQGKQEASPTSKKA